MSPLTPARRIAAAIAALSIISTLAFAAPAVADDITTTEVVSSTEQVVVDDTTTEEEAAPEEQAPELQPAGVESSEPLEEEAPQSRAIGIADAIVADPVQLTQVAPADGAHLYPADNTVTLSWTDPQVGSNTYKIQGTNTFPGTGDIQNAPFLYDAPMVGTSGTQSYTVPASTVPGTGVGTYWWQVRAVNANGVLGPWSTVRQVIVGKVTPTNVGCTAAPQTVGIVGTSQLDLSQTRADGTVRMTTGGLSLVWGPNATSTAKAAWYYPVNFPLTQIGTTSINYSGTGAGVGENYTVVALRPGMSDLALGNIVRESAYYTGYWTTFDGTQGLTDPHGYASKSINDILSQMYVKHPTWTLQVVAIGGSGGSGTVGSGVLQSQTAGCLTLNYAGPAAPTNQQCRAAATPLVVSASSQLNLTDTRVGGSSKVTPNGMALAWHGDGASLSTSKVAWYYATNFPLSQIGSPVMDYTVNSGASIGQNFSIAVNGTFVGNIVSEPGIPNYWTTFSIPGMKADPTASYRKAIGTINDFLAAYNSWDPSAVVTVVAVGGSGGSGSEGTGILRSQGFACYVLTYSATALGAPTQIAPANNSVVSSHDFPMSWSDYPAGTTFQIFSTTNDPGTSPVVTDPIKTELFPNPAPLTGVPDAVYWWQVRAIDPDGNVGAWSSIWKVTVDTTVPSTPTPLTPGGWNMAAGEFTWGASTDATAVTYEVITGNHPNVDADGRMTSGVQVIGTDISGTWLPYAFPTGPVQWQVRAKDAAGNYSAWSAPYGAQIIGTPSIITPTAGTNASGSTYDVTWTPAYGIGGNERYDLEFTYLTGGVPTTSVVSVDGNLTSYTQDFTADDYQGVISVRVRAVYNIGWVSGDRSSRLGPWSTAVSYLRDSVGPVKPQPQNPSNGGTFSATSTTTYWTAAADAVKFEVRTSTGPSRDGSNMLNGTSPDVTVTLPQTTSLDQPLTGLPEGYTWWQVRAYDQYGNAGPWSDIWAFGVDTIAPGDVTLNQLPNNTITSSNTFDLTWFAATDAVKYVFESTKVAQSSTPGDFTSLTGGGYVLQAGTSFNAGGAPDGTYYWHVRAVDVAGNLGAWSETRAVTIDRETPEAVTLLTPANPTSTTATSATFTWESLETVPLYAFEISSASDDLDATGSFSDFGVGGAFPATGPSIDAASLPVGTYYWHVKAIDAAGNESAWSPVWTLKVTAPVVAPPANPGGTTTPPAAVPFIIVTPTATAAAIAAVAPAAAPVTTPADSTTEELPTEATTDQLPTEAFDGQPTAGDAPWWPWAVGIAILLLLALLWFMFLRRRRAGGAA